MSAQHYITVSITTLKGTALSFSLKAVLAFLLCTTTILHSKKLLIWLVTYGVTMSLALQLTLKLSSIRKQLFIIIIKWLINIYILVICTILYLSMFLSGTTAHDILLHREDRILDTLENMIILSMKQKHAREVHCQKYIHTKCSHCSADSIRLGSDADGVSHNGIILGT